MAEKSLIPGQHSKERLSLMQSILNKMLMETGFKSGAAHTSSDYDEFLAEGEVKNFVNLTFHMSKPSTTGLVTDSFFLCFFYCQCPWTKWSHRLMARR